ncbi:hypothetical protein [Bacteriophage sp.]|nr:hypothetical protein [Caudoviricetes sp.]UOF79987.1 hypothetical protein [Bacteriophage sp.]
MSGVATAIVGSAITGGVVASNSASKAANAQRDAANTASQTELEQYYQNREDMQPWREAGQGALGQLTSGTAAGGDFNRDFTLADFTKDPGYDFRLQQGQRGVEASAAARGGILSGAALKGLTRYNQDYASGEFQNAYNRFNNDRTQRFNRLASIAGVGQTATRDVAQMGSQTASNVANNIIGAGNAQASSYVGQGNAISGAANTLGNFAMNKYYLSQMPGGAATMPSTPSYGGTPTYWDAAGSGPTYG